MDALVPAPRLVVLERYRDEADLDDPPHRRHFLVEPDEIEMMLRRQALPAVPLDVEIDQVDRLWVRYYVHPLDKYGTGRVYIYGDILRSHIQSLV